MAKIRPIELTPTRTGVSQDDLRQAALDQLAIEGGKLHGEDDIVFSGTKFILPETCVDLDEAIDFLGARRDAEEALNTFTKVYPYRPLDGARATARAITDGSGFNIGKATWSFWTGQVLPTLNEIKVGPKPDDVELVPSGTLMIPGLDRTQVTLSHTTDPELGQVFRLVIEAPLKYKHHIAGLFKRVDKYLREASMYRGKAINGGMEFIDIRTPDLAIYTERVQARLNGEVWARIRYSKKYKQLGQSLKRAFLLEGPYGSGKTLAADETAKVADEFGWTFLFARPAKDDLALVMQTARMYQPAVVFVEDVDTVAAAGTDGIERVLDLMDGIDTKGLELLVLMTTNHVETIHKGMIRPGRLHGIIHIGAMDAPGIRALTEAVVGDGLSPVIDWEAVTSSMDGYMPAFVREALDRTVGYSVAHNDGELGLITTEDIVAAADSLREQYSMMEDAAENVPKDTVEAAIKRVVTSVIDGTSVCDEDDGYHRFDLVASNNGG